jgi:S-methylmethionine-dependent homocysteine/selenocysteine methylase
MIFHKGLELPEFAAIDLLKNDEGWDHLYEYFSSYASIARQFGLGIVLDCVTWRASADWGTKIGYSPEELEILNKRAVDLLLDIRGDFETVKTKVIISGCVGPRGDGYDADHKMTVDEAEAYHFEQLKLFSESPVDMVSALTLPHTKEAIGITKASSKLNLPVVISFTVETDGRLPSGRTLKEAIEIVDMATNNGPLYYMINCAHPTHFRDVLQTNENWVHRIRGIRANASCKSHAELDEATELDEGDPYDLSDELDEIRQNLPNINILGGCCGTDHRHIEQIAKQYSPVNG